MKRISTIGTVISAKKSEVRKGVYYITVDTPEWGQVKYVSTRNSKVGETVELQDQKCRAMHDMIRWEEKR